MRGSSRINSKLNTLPNNNRRHFLSSSTGLLLSAPWFSGKAFSAEAPVVETSNGKVRGYRNDDVFTFKGVRYGASTGGAKRFMPPRVPEPWAGIHDATAYGYSAPQTNPATAGTAGGTSPLELIFGASNGFRAAPDENEDCLFLNVWTRSLSQDAKRPVAVWLHGGGFASGSASLLMYDGTNMASRSDLVVVGINHRLNTFGYTNLAELGGSDYANSGNAGQLDIIQALEWVRDNIERFGGDPQRVMVFGESGGGAKVSFLLASPPAQGLFHRAVIESGPGITMGEPEDATQAAEMLLKELNIPRQHLARIHEVSTQQILAAYFAALVKLPANGLGAAGGFGPVLNPEVLPAHPFSPQASSLSENVPVIVGWNRTETTLFMLGDEAAFRLDEAGLQTRLQGLFGERAQQIADAYAIAGGSPSDRFFRITGDQMMGANSILLAERKAALGKAPAFLYRFDWESPVLKGKLRSSHGMEMPFVFDNTEEGGIGITGGGAQAAQLAAEMRATWASFAETGDPNAWGGLPQWRPYDKQRFTMVFNEDTVWARDPDRAEREAMALFNGAV